MTRHRRSRFRPRSERPGPSTWGTVLLAVATVAVAVAYAVLSVLFESR
jgi:hypothetical protein